MTNTAESFSKGPNLELTPTEFFVARMTDDETLRQAVINARREGDKRTVVSLFLIRLGRTNGLSEEFYLNVDTRNKDYGVEASLLGVVVEDITLAHLGDRWSRSIEGFAEWAEEGWPEYSSHKVYRDGVSYMLRMEREFGEKEVKECLSPEEMGLLVSSLEQITQA